MNPEQRELFRQALLRVLDEHASDRFGLSIAAIQIFLGQFGFRESDRKVIVAELQYLSDKRLAATVGKIISPENTCWRITADGRDYLAGATPESE